MLFHFAVKQIAVNNSSDIEFRDFMILYKKNVLKKYSVLVNDNTLASEILYILERIF